MRGEVGGGGIATRADRGVSEQEGGLRAICGLSLVSPTVEGAMNRRSIIASLFAMVLAPLGLRVPKPVSLSGNSPVDVDVRVTAIDHSARSITIDANSTWESPRYSMRGRFSPIGKGEVTDV